MASVLRARTSVNPMTWNALGALLLTFWPAQASASGPGAPMVTLGCVLCAVLGAGVAILACGFRRKCRELSESQSQLRAALEMTRTVAWVLDPETGETTQVVGSIPGVDSLLVDMPRLSAVLSPGDREALETEQARLQKEGSFGVEFQVPSEDGTLRTVAARGVLRDFPGGKRRLLGVSQDVTEARSAQREIELHRAQLVAASKLSAVGEMAGGIAHEINTPLAILLGYASQLKEQALSPEGIDPARLVRSAERIEQTALRMSRVVRALRLLPHPHPPKTTRAPGRPRRMIP